MNTLARQACLEAIRRADAEISRYQRIISQVNHQISIEQHKKRQALQRLASLYTVPGRD